MTKGVQKRLDVFCAFREMLIKIAVRWQKLKSKNTDVGEGTGNT